MRPWGRPLGATPAFWHDAGLLATVLFVVSSHRSFFLFPFLAFCHFLQIKRRVGFCIFGRAAAVFKKVKNKGDSFLSFSFFPSFLLVPSSLLRAIPKRQRIALDDSFLFFCARDRDRRPSLWFRCLAACAHTP
ncbi:hypothetical protein pdul_cds_535 [Pandoravirus dulcis]|uniref:Transmembrane protein n=1 Tax=Pandoravirus dulcis TaxID=1349409 RepID=S4VX32_9VIRU|nr:hypothetical protein pdul_cds_535 [Pandoravirus dulcis]AGO82636.1 hypothetical protein pdul_cds_535 [Pandoravirus dulcis]